MLQVRPLCPPYRGGIPIAAREEALAALLHGAHQHHVAGAQQPDSEYSVAAERVAYNANGSVDEAALLVEVPAEADNDTRLRHNTQV